MFVAFVMQCHKIFENITLTDRTFNFNFLFLQYPFFVSLIVVLFIEQSSRFCELISLYSQICIPF